MKDSRTNPSGIPSFRPGILTATESLVRKSKYHVIDYERGPFSVKALAEYSAKMELLAHYREELPLIGLAIIAGGLLGLDVSDLLIWNAISPEVAVPFTFGFAYGCLLLVYFGVRAARSLPSRGVARHERVKLHQESESYQGRWSPFTYLRKLDLTRSFFVFLALILLVVFMTHWFSLVLQAEFRVATDRNAVEHRTLAAFEFLYFFSVTYTTLGFGDIVPTNTPARALVLFINFLTLYSVIYWYSAIRIGPRQLTTNQILNRYTAEHISRLNKLLKLLIEIEKLRGVVACPRTRTTHEQCLTCGGSGRVSPEVALSYLAWPRRDLLWSVCLAAQVDYWCMLARVLTTDITRDFWFGNYQSVIPKSPYAEKDLVDRRLAAAQLISKSTGVELLLEALRKCATVPISKVRRNTPVVQPLDVEPARDRSA